MRNLLEIKDLCVQGRPPGGEYVPIVKGIDFSIKPGEVLALIGESGSGKSTISLATMGYARPGCRISKGEVLLNHRCTVSHGSYSRTQTHRMVRKTDFTIEELSHMRNRQNI